MSARVRLLFVSPYPPARDGIGDYTRELVSGLRVLGHDARVVSARGAAESPPEVVEGLPGSAAERAALSRMLETWRPDAVHVQFGVAAFGTRTGSLMRLLRMVRARQVPVVVTMHEVTRDTALLGAPGRFLYRRIAAQADRLLVHNGPARKMLVEQLGVDPRRVEVVPLPTPELPPAELSPEALRVAYGLGPARVLLAFGFIHVDKGLGDLVDALSRLRARRPDLFDAIRLVVAGAVRPRRGPFRVFELRDRLHLARVRRRLRVRGLDDAVVFTGYVPAGTVRPWFELAAAAVLPYRRIDQSAVASLAAAAGTPVVASTAGALSERTPRYAFPPRAPDRLTDALERFLDDAASGSIEAPAPHRQADSSTVIERTLSAYLVAGAPHASASAER